MREKNSALIGNLTCFTAYAIFGFNIISCKSIAIAVATKARKQGVAQGLYEELFDAIGDKETYSTRTWESNEYHQRILNKLGFRLKERKDEGRTDINGKPVPSLYYIKVD